MNIFYEFDTFYFDERCNKYMCKYRFNNLFFFIVNDYSVELVTNISTNMKGSSVFLFEKSKKINLIGPDGLHHVIMMENKFLMLTE